MSSYTPEEYQALEKQLTDRGYRRFGPPSLPSERYDWYYAKNVRDSEGDMMYYIAFIVYDRSTWQTSDPMVTKWPYGVEIKIYVTHACELHLWERQYTIDEIETAAAKFHELCTTLKLNICTE